MLKKISNFCTDQFILALGLLIFFVSVVRLYLATLYPLSPDEAHYWLWSLFPDWFYFSKGPVVAWLIAIGTAIGGHTELGVRLPAVFFSGATSVLIFLLAKNIYDIRTAWAVTIVGLLVPMYALGSIVMTIDVPSVFFWSAAAISSWSAWRTNSTLLWIVTGFCVGMGFLAKYTNAVQGLCLGLLLAGTAQGRRQLLTPWPWLGLFVALCCTLPYWAWNAQNGWVSWEHLLSRGQLKTAEAHDISFRINPVEFVMFLALQAIVISPVLWVIVVTANAHSFMGLLSNQILKQNSTLNSESEEGRQFFLLCHSLPILMVFGFFALNDAGQPNWTAPGYVTAGILAAHWVLCRWDKSALLRRTTFAGLILAVVGTIILHDTRALRLPRDVDPLARVRGWNILCEKILTIQKERDVQMIIANHYGLASALNWHMPGPRGGLRIYRSLRPGKVNDQFSFWPNYLERSGEDALLVMQIRGDQISRKIRPPKILREQFEEWEALGEPFWLSDNGLKVAPYALFHLKRLKPTESLKAEGLN